MIDFGQLQGDGMSAETSQVVYILTRSEQSFNQLYRDCRKIAVQQLKYISTKSQYVFDRDRFNQVVDDATANLLEYYVRKPDYYIRHFKTRIHQELARVLYAPYGRGACDKRWNEHHVQLDEDHYTIPQVEEEKLDLTYALQDLLSEHTKGKQIVIDIYRATSYKQAILTIAKYVDKRWIYDRAEKLYRVYRFTRRKKHGKAKEST